MEARGVSGVKNGVSEMEGPVAVSEPPFEIEER